MNVPRISRGTCSAHGFTLSPKGSCLECERESARTWGPARVILGTAAALLGLLIVGVAGARARIHHEAPGTEPSTTSVSGVNESTAVVRELPIPSGSPPQSPEAPSEAHAVLEAWQSTLADAEAKRAKELAAAELVRAAAEKKQIEDAYKLPPSVRGLASLTPERQHGRILTFPSDYGDHPWLEESETHQASKASLPEIAEALSMAPPAAEFLTVPVHVFLLHSDSYPAISASPDLAESVPHFIDKANRIFAAAGISLVLAEVAVAEADNSSFEWSGPTTSGSQTRPDRHRVARAVPASSAATDGFRIYFVHDFDCNGVYHGHGDAVVKETSRSRGVPGGTDESMPRVMAHEIGHGLGLGHTRTVTNLMASGTAGTKLSFAQAQRVRSVALAWPGVHGVDPMNPPRAVLEVAGRVLQR